MQLILKLERDALPMPSSWKEIYPWIQSALITYQSSEEFCEQAIAQVTAAYHTEGWLWVGLENPETVQVYGSGTTSEPNDAALPDSMSWLTEQHPSLKTTQLHTGDLVIPVIHPVESSVFPEDSTSHQMALQLRRPPLDGGNSPSVLLSENREQAAIYGWSAEELNSLEIVASQIGLAYELLQARQNVRQFRQQIALLSRIAYLLNSNLPLEAQLMRLLGDVGSGIGCDRGFVVRLRERALLPMASWNMKDALGAVEFSEDNAWQDAIDLFEDGAASHLEILPRSSVETKDFLQDWLMQQDSEAGILMPIHIRGQFFGMVGLLSSTARGGYRIDELQLLRQATEQLAIALATVYQPSAAIPETWMHPSTMYDSLTGCETRASLEQTLDQMSIHPDWGSMATSLILCNLDYFKLVNDTYGHNVGDQVLQAIAYRFREHLRHPTKIYRYGGEEFAILLTDTPQTSAMRVAERLRWAVSDTPIKTSAGDVPITASFGVAQQPQTAEGDTWVMLHRAEAAIQEAKRQGRNQVIGR